MSLLALLVDFPNYSARKVRRLAKQIAILRQVVDQVDEPSVLKGIETDLMEFNLNEAKREAQLNDDLQVPIEPIRMMVEAVTTERVMVVPVELARQALADLTEFVRVHSDIILKGSDLDVKIQRCHGIINGGSFYTDRQVIKTEED